MVFEFWWQPENRFDGVFDFFVFRFKPVWDFDWIEAGLGVGIFCFKDSE